MQTQVLIRPLLLGILRAACRRGDHVLVKTLEQ
jgi:hypothetical protein